MQTYLKTRPVWIQLLLFMGMAFGLFMIFSLLGVAILSGITGIEALAVRDISNWNTENPNMIVFIRGLLLVQFLGLFVIPTLLFGYFADPAPGKYLGLKKPHRTVFWILAVVVMLVAIPMVDLLGYINQKMAFGRANEYFKTMEEQATQQIKFMLNRHTPAELIKNLVFIALFAGVGEELFFRGVLQNLFIRATRNAWMGIVIAALLFSAMHLQFFGFFPRLFLGVVLGAIYWYSGSLWAAMLAHFAYDAFMIILVYYNPSMIDNMEATLMKESVSMMIVYGLISATIVWVLLRTMRRFSPANETDLLEDESEPGMPQKPEN